MSASEGRRRRREEERAHRKANRPTARDVRASFMAVAASMAQAQQETAETFALLGTVAEAEGLIDHAAMPECLAALVLDVATGATAFCTHVGRPDEPGPFVLFNDDRLVKVRCAACALAWSRAMHHASLDTNFLCPCCQLIKPTLLETTVPVGPVLVIAFLCPECASWLVAGGAWTARDAEVETALTVIGDRRRAAG